MSALNCLPTDTRVRMLNNPHYMLGPLTHKCFKCDNQQNILWIYFLKCDVWYLNLYKKKKIKINQKLSFGIINLIRKLLPIGFLLQWFRTWTTRSWNYVVFHLSAFLLWEKGWIDACVPRPNHHMKSSTIINRLWINTASSLLPRMNWQSDYHHRCTRFAVKT